MLAPDTGNPVLESVIVPDIRPWIVPLVGGSIGTESIRSDVPTNDGGRLTSLPVSVPENESGSAGSGVRALFPWGEVNTAQSAIPRRRMENSPTISCFFDI